MPREYGAYAELLFPLATGLALGQPGLAAISFAVAAILLFLSHEPISVLIGARGARAKEMWSTRSLRQASGLAIAGVIAGIVAVLTTTPDARMAVLVPTSCAVVLLPALISGRVKTLPGEILVATTLAGTVLPVGIAGGVAWSTAWVVAGVWFASFLLATLAVHAIKARTKEAFGARWTTIATPVLALATFGVAIPVASLGMVRPMIVFALLPTAVVTVVVSIMRVRARRLRTVGWSLVSANVVTLALLMLG